jgi:hypothetical protein
MTAKAGLISVAAVLLMALADGSLSAGSARAVEICLAAPNAPAPQGSHWYYRTDFIKQSKCWYLRAEGQAIETPTAQQKPESTAAKRPAMPKTAPDQAAPEAKQLRPVQPAPAKLGDRLRQSSTQDATQASHQGRGDTVTWPDPPTPAGADNVVRPDSPSQTSSAPQGATAASIPEERANQTQEEPARAANPDKDAGKDAGVARPVADEVAVSHSEMPASLFWAFVIGLVIAGILVRRIVRMTFARRRTVFPDRAEPVGTTSITSGCAKPKFVAHYRDLASGWVDNDRPNDEVKEALRKLLLVLDRQAA